MASASGPGVSSANPFIRLVSEAAAQNRLAGLTEILRVLAESVEAGGCILWEMASGTGVEKRRLFVLAEYFAGSTSRTWHYLSPESVTWQAITSGKRKEVPDTEASPVGDKADRQFISRKGIRACCSAPISLRKTDAPDAAIAVYWTKPRRLSPADLGLVSDLAGLIPHLYSSLVNHVGFDLLQKIDVIISGARQPAAPWASAGQVEALKKTLDQIINLVAETFNASEAAIYLEDPIHSPGEFRLWALKWPWGPGRKPPESYAPMHGATGYVIGRQRSVRIFDLGRYEEDLEIIHREYPGLKWSDPIGLRTAAREVLLENRDGELPPLSFMCAPIINQNKILGAIRCCATKTGPHFFDDRQVQVLQFVADQLGDWWGDYIRITRESEENARWVAVGRGISELNRFVHAELNKANPSENRIMDRVLEVASEIHPAADILSVSLLDEAGTELYYAATRGEAWDQRAGRHGETRRSRRLPVNAPEGRYAAVDCFRSGRTIVVQEVNSRVYQSVFSEVRTMVFAPVASGKTTYGTLGIRGTSGEPLPPHAAATAELLGRQLGLYHFLALKMGELYATRERLNATVETEQRFYEDFQHQIKTPVMLAFRKAQGVVERAARSTVRTEDLESLRSLCRSADQVSRNVGLFVALAKGEQMPIGPSVLTVDDLTARLMDLARDHSEFVDPTREIRFEVNALSFEVLLRCTVFVDQILFEQAVGNLLDNAGKYSFPKTAVRVRGGLTRLDKYFFLSVANEGIKVDPSESRKLAERGYRADRAQWVTGYGRGIGLWVVDQIIKRHRGVLEVIPTTSQGVTDFRLLFPVLE